MPPLTPPKTSAPVPDITPAAFKVFPLVPTVHVGLPVKTMLFEMVKLTLVREIAPIVNVPKPEIPMSDNAFDTAMLPQVSGVPSVNPKPDDVFVQVATSDAVGEPLAPEPPDQTPAVAPVRSVPDACLVAIPAWVDGAYAANRLKHTIKAIADLIGLMPDAGKFAVGMVPVWRKKLMKMESGRGAVLIGSILFVSAHKISLTH